MGRSRTSASVHACGRPCAASSDALCPPLVTASVADVVAQLGEEGVAVDVSEVRLVEGEGEYVDRLKTTGEFVAEVSVEGVWLPVRVSVVAKH